MEVGKRSLASRWAKEGERARRRRRRNGEKARLGDDEMTLMLYMEGDEGVKKTICPSDATRRYKNKNKKVSRKKKRKRLALTPIGSCRP